MSAIDAWSLSADGFGLLSGLLLGYSALRINKLLREAADLRNRLLSSRSGLDKHAYQAMRKKAQEQAGSWSKSDERRLYGGMAALVLSFVCSLIGSLLNANVL